MNQSSPPEQPELIRGVGLAGATTLNMIDMIGVGPFITIPADRECGGRTASHARLDFGRRSSPCAMDWYGPSWAQPCQERAAPIATSKKFTDREPWDGCCRSFSSGNFRSAHHCRLPRAVSDCRTMPDICGPDLTARSRNARFISALPGLGALEARVVLMPGTFVAIATCALVVFLLYRRITAVAKIAELLWVGGALAMTWIIVAGFMHFRPRLGIRFPARRLSPVS